MNIEEKKSKFQIHETSTNIVEDRTKKILSLMEKLESAKSIKY